MYECMKRIMIPAFTLGGAVGRVIKTKTLIPEQLARHICGLSEENNENNKIMMLSLTSRESPEAAAGWNMFVDYF